MIVDCFHSREFCCDHISIKISVSHTYFYKNRICYSKRHLNYAVWLLLIASTICFTLAVHTNHPKELRTLFLPLSPVIRYRKNNFHWSENISNLHIHPFVCQTQSVAKKKSISWIGRESSPLISVLSACAMQNITSYYSSMCRSIEEICSEGQRMRVTHSRL